MGEAITRSTFVEASPEKVSGIILDLSSYPSWQKEVQHVEIRSTDQRNRPVEAQFDIAAMGQKASYTVVYSYPAEGVIEAHLVAGDMITKQDQRYELSETSNGTDVSYSLDMDVKWAIPDFMIRSIVTKGIRTNLEGIKSRAES